MPQVSVRQLYEDNAKKLQLVWVAGKAGGDNLLTNDIVQKPTLSLVGHLNFVHPNRVQVLGVAEMAYLKQLDATTLRSSLLQLFSNQMAAMIVANGEPATPELIDACEAGNVPLFSSPEKSPYLMDVMRFYLAKALAVSTIMHGVFLDVLEVGVLLTGGSAMGKSELALELTPGDRSN